MTDTDPAPWRYARPGSPLGALERGRGLGWALALADPAAGAEALLDCLRRDTRWDWGVDQRAGYHAFLVTELALPADPLTDLLDGPDAYGSARARETLAELALLGSAPARAALRRYVRYGEWWQETLTLLAGRWPLPWWDDLRPAALGRLGGERPVYWRAAPWPRWQPEPPSAPRPPRPVPLAPRTGRLLAALADPGTAPDDRAEALRALACRPVDPAGLLPLITESATADHAPAGLHDAVRRLGPAALAPAREWAAADHPALRRLGLQVLAEHGGNTELPLLVAELADQWARDEWCGPKLLADGLARYGPSAAEAAPLLRRFWHTTPHSYERPSYLRALHAIAPGAAAPLLSESLWDCEPDARLYAVRHLPDDPRFAHRLAQLRDSPAEDDDLRAAAARRLG
ncbi:MULTISPECIES: hypothetical protein [Kitasatospora]|uniref:HEAT repeat domain-containing protein n=1 Tax=Kitasatospora setae (strain ATCC 33774 / DSM 43861 / JCM 3304 / KCC A-0304 / NBRC 14216 / KM-6054) TaxID=452652 RepID=E4N0U4_KITSK|nr:MULTISPECIES: hypothetical protein [Kitasatospora]BAJ31778.1 hypothetical protein KSE_60090 [Kitasatospora setae KM-6054]